MSEQQLSLKNQLRLEKGLKLIRFSHAGVEVLELKVNNVMDVLIPLVAEGVVPVIEIENVMAFDKEVQALIWSVHESYGSMQILVDCVLTDNHADNIYVVIKTHTETMTKQIQNKMYKIAEMEKRLKDTYHLN